MESSNLTYTKYLEIEQFEDKMIIQDYICPLCTGVYNNPVVDGCGHVFCNECINISMKKSVYCPISYRDLSKENFHQIPFISSIIAKHVINCKNKCGWKKSLNNYQTHLDEECPNILLSCKFENCKQCYLRSEKESHTANCDFRLVQCEFCKESIAFVELNKHYDVCPNVKVECTQICGLQIKRSDIEKHMREICPKTNIDCMFKAIGCDKGFPRSEENKHNEDFKENHLKLIGKNFEEQKAINEKMKKVIDDVDILKEKIEKVEKMKEDFVNRKYLNNDL
jgi:TRAF-type zinc finger/Zinc finger, C3HC4 type (RING finger)